MGLCSTQEWFRRGIEAKSTGRIRWRQPRDLHRLQG